MEDDRHGAVASERHFWLFCTVDAFDGANMVPARQVVEERLRRGVWPLGERTPLRRWLRPGDVALLYVGGRDRDRLTIIGHVELQEVVSHLSPRERSRVLSEADAAGLYSYGVRVANASMFARPIPIKELAGELSILPAGLAKWGNVVKAGIRRLTANDYANIVAYARQASGPIRRN